MPVKKQAWLYFGFVLGTILASSAMAQAISDATSCAAARAIMEAPEPKNEDLVAIGDYVKSILYKLDNMSGTLGRPAPIAPMSEDERNNMVDLVMTRCAGKPMLMLQDVTTQVYADLRASKSETNVTPGK